MKLRQSYLFFENRTAQHLGGKLSNQGQDIVRGAYTEHNSHLSEGIQSAREHGDENDGASSEGTGGREGLIEEGTTNDKSQDLKA